MESKLQRKILRTILYGATLASVLLSPGCKDKTHVSEMANSNVRTYTGHASREIVTDIDFDGKYDVLETIVVGKGKKLFFKRGYGPAQDPGIECQFVEPDLFKNYDAELFKNMVKEYYRLETKNE